MVCRRVVRTEGPPDHGHHHGINGAVKGKEWGREKVFTKVREELDNPPCSGHHIPAPNHPDMESQIKNTKESMHKAVEHLIHEFAAVRTGKASPQLVENIDVKVSIYGGTHMKLKQLAAITTPEARLLVVQPFDASTLQDIERSIRESNIGINPATEGKTIRLPVPELTEERRRDLVKVVKHQAEDARVSVRSIRRDAMDKTKKMEKAKEINEDQRHDLEAEIQKLTDQAVHEIDDHTKRKEEEVMTV